MNLFKERLDVLTKVEVLQSKIPTILIDINALGKMKTYVDECFDEIGWLATVEELGKGLYLIKDTFLFKQQVHGTTCEITTDGLTEFANELLMQENGVETWNEIRCWGHSHVNMGVSPSSQDDKQMEVFEGCGHDFFIRLIANKKGELELTLYDYKTGLIYKDVKWTVYYQNVEIYEIEKQIKELKEKADKLKTPTINTDNIKSEMKEKVSKIEYNVKGIGNNIINKYGNHIDNVYYGNYYEENFGKQDVKKKEKNLSFFKEELKNAYLEGDTSFVEDNFLFEEIVEYAYAQVVTLQDILFEEHDIDLSYLETHNFKTLCQKYLGLL